MFGFHSTPPIMDVRDIQAHKSSLQFYAAKKTYGKMASQELGTMPLYLDHTLCSSV